jgi:hypothetical protein
MTTTIVKTIGTGGDYSTPQAWEDAAPADLTAVDQIWQGQLLNQAFSGTGVQLVIAGSTTSATQYKELTCAAGASWRDNASVRSSAFAFNASAGASITSTSTAGQAAVQLNEANARLTKVQVRNTDLVSNSAAVDVLNSSGGIRLDSVIAQAANAQASALYRSKSFNCLFISLGGQSFIATIDTTGEIHSSTLVRPSDKTVATYGLNSNYATGVLVKNTALLGCTTTASNQGGVTFTTCATSAAIPPTGAVTVALSTANVTNTVSGTLDMRPPSGSALIDAGTTDATITTDATGISRPQGTNPDIGAWEYTAPASGITGNVTADDAVAAGSFVSVSSGLSGNITADNAVAAGVLGQLPGVLTTPPIKNNTGSTLLASVTGIAVNVYSASTGLFVTRQTGLTSNSSGTVTITDASLTPGASYAYEIDLSAAGLGRRLPVGVAA